jgi:NRPS condensation-like uncharacterized protein
MEINLKNKTTQLRTDSKIGNLSGRFRASSLDKLMYYSHPFHDGQCRCVIRFNGRIDIPGLTRAVELSLKVAPILGYKFVYHPWRSCWKKDLLSTIGLPFKHSETHDPEKETEKFLTDPIDTKQGLQVSVCLIRSEYDTLCIKLSHMVADARGLLDYIHILRKWDIITFTI